MNDVVAVPLTPPAARPRLLLVDDEPELRNALGAVLSREFDVETAPTTEEAEVRFTLRPFDLVICDHLLARETGLDFLIRMGERWPLTRRILLTGYMNPELISRSVSVAGLSACLLKPVTGTELIQAVHTALAAPVRP